MTKDVLREAKMTNAEYQQFLKEYEALLKQKAANPTPKEQLLPPQRGNAAALPNQGVRRVDARNQPRAGEADKMGPALPPRRIREANKEFSKKLSDLQQSGEQKP